MNETTVSLGKDTRHVVFWIHWSDQGEPIGGGFDLTTTVEQAYRMYEAVSMAMDCPDRSVYLMRRQRNNHWRVLSVHHDDAEAAKNAGMVEFNLIARLPILHTIAGVTVFDPNMEIMKCLPKTR